MKTLRSFIISLIIRLTTLAQTFCWRKFAICASVTTFFLVSNAQSPQSFKYQTVLRNASGQVLANQDVEIGIAILQGSISGVEVFSETHNTTTNSFGLANLDIGSVNTSGFAAIDWANGPYFVQVLVDGTVMGTSQLLSVPYALLASTVENDQVDDADADPTNELQDITFSNGVLGITQGSSIPLNIILPNIDTSNTNELQDISLSGTDLSISEGSTVDLSVIQDGTGTDNQELSLHDKRNLKISGGNIISLPYLLSESDGSPTNELQTLSKSGLEISLNQNGGIIRDSILTEIQVDAMVSNNGFQLAADDNDVDPTNELQVLSINHDTLFLSSGSAVELPHETDPVYTVDSSFIKSGVRSWTNSLAKQITTTDTTHWGQDTDPTNELNSNVVLNGTNLEISDDGGTISTSLSSLINDSDADPINEIQTISRSGLTVTLNKSGGTYQDSILTETEVDAMVSDNGYQLESSDLDIDSTNELNQTIILNGSNLEVTDAGGTISTDLSSLTDDADADPLNEIQTISRSGLTVTLNKSGGTYQDSVLTETDVDNMISNNGFQLETNDMDIDSTNELQTLSISNDTIYLTDGGVVKLPVPDVFEDADADTKIQVEESPDEDIIRFDLGGSEKWVMKGARMEPKNTGYSVFIGEDAGLNDDLSDNGNTFIGYQCGFSNISGNANNALGYQAFFSNTTGWGNNAIGYQALYSNTTGLANTANGYQALYSNTTGTDNIANGSYALYSNVSGEHNIANGYKTLYSNTIGNGNTANGGLALYSNTTGNYNTANGTDALRSNTTGSYNTADGGGALYSNTTGSNNTAVGSWAGYTNETGIANVFMGYRAGYYETGSSKLYIDNDDSTFPLIYGEFDNNIVAINNTLGIGTQYPTAGYALHVNGKAISTQATFDVSSDRRVKKNITKITNGLEIIGLLNPVTFNYTDEYKKKSKDLSGLKYGFIAQEVKKIIPEAVTIVEETVGTKTIKDFNVLNTSSIIPLLVSAVKQLKENNEELEIANNGIKNQNNQIEQRIETLETLMGKVLANGSVVKVEE